MPSYLRGQQRDLLRFVLVYSDGNLYYGFNTKDFASLSGYGLSQQEITVLGHYALDAVPESGILIFRANSPKPARVKKVINRNPTAEQIGNASTFISAGQLRAASAEGWKLAVDGRGISLASNPRNVTVVADLEDSAGLYAGSLNANDFDTYGEILGLQTKATITTQQERQRIFSGASRPRPPVVARELDNGSTFTSICSASALSGATSDANGFSLLKAEVKFG